MTLPKSPTGTNKEQAIQLVSTDGERLFSSDKKPSDVGGAVLTPETSWTPVLSDGTNECTMNSSSAGRYWSVGDIYFITCYILIDSLGSASGDARITGLPQTALNINAEFDFALSVGSSASLAMASPDMIVAEVENNTTYISLYTMDAATGTSAMQISEVSVNGELKLNGFYIGA